MKFVSILYLYSFNLEIYSRGSRGAPAKGVGRATGARVQIPQSPPKELLRHSKTERYQCLLGFWSVFSFCADLDFDLDEPFSTFNWLNILQI